MIEIQPFTGVDSSWVSAIASTLETQWNVRTRILETVDLPRSAWESERKRYWAAGLLDALALRKSPTADRILGICREDIAVEKGEGSWGVMGLARLTGPSAVISAFRPSGQGATKELVKYRLQLLAQHELAHTTGRNHCADTTCLLTDARGRMTIDRANRFCDACKSHVLEWVGLRN